MAEARRAPAVIEKKTEFDEFVDMLAGLLAKEVDEFVKTNTFTDDEGKKVVPKIPIQLKERAAAGILANHRTPAVAALTKELISRLK